MRSLRSSCSTASTRLPAPRRCVRACVRVACVCVRAQSADRPRAPACQAFVNKVVSTQFLERVDRADKATKIIFNYMFDHPMGDYSDLSGLTLSD